MRGNVLKHRGGPIDRGLLVDRIDQVDRKDPVDRIDREDLQDHIVALSLGTNQDTTITDIRGRNLMSLEVPHFTSVLANLENYT